MLPQVLIITVLLGPVILAASCVLLRCAAEVAGHCNGSVAQCTKVRITARRQACEMDKKCEYRLS